MKRNTKLVDNDSDNEIWQYKSGRQLKHTKLRRPGKERKLLNNYGMQLPPLTVGSQQVPS